MIKIAAALRLAVMSGKVKASQLDEDERKQYLCNMIGEPSWMILDTDEPFADDVSPLSIAATQRLRAAIGGQPLSDSFGRQQLRRYTMFLQKYPNKIEQDLGTKDGLTMHLVHDGLDRVITLSTDDRKVVAYGKLEDSPFSNRKRMYNLYVDKDWRGKKLANVLHLGAAHVYKHLESDTTMAVGALKAFKSLERFGYHIKLYDTNTGKTLPFKWGPNDIPEVNGESIADAEHYALYV
jgi:hypothetical protein